MLKHNYVINLGLAVLLVVPAVTVGTQEPVRVEITLDQTIAALEQLAGLETRLQQHDTRAIADVLAWTEPALANPADQPAARDALLDTLRNEVVGLQGELDGDTQMTSAGELATTPAPIAPTTTGFSEDLRVALGPTRPPNAPSDVVVKLPAAATQRPQRLSFEAENYTADALELGRAYYRRQKFDAALLLFESLGTNIESTYWKARCLERLGRTDEALSAYAQVIASPAASWEVARAKEDVDFLKWRLAFERVRAPASATAAATKAQR